MAERQSGGITALRGSTVEELRQELQFALQHLANQVDQLQGNRGTPTIRADVDLTGKRLTNIGAPRGANDAVPASLALTRPSAAQPYDAGGTTIINVQGGATTSDAVNVSQLRDALAASDLSGETFLVVSLSGKLLQERQLAGEATVLTLTDAGAGSTLTLSVATNGITNTKLRQGAALSVIGRAANSTGNVADVAAVAASDAVLRESGSSVGFGTVATAGLANNAVTDPKLRDSAAVSVIGRSANSSGDPADIAASADGQVLRRAANVVGFGAVDLADSDAVTGVLPSANLPSATWADQTASRALNTTYTQGSATRAMLVLATVRCAITLAAGTAYVQAKQDTSTPPTTVASGICGVEAGLLNEDNSFMVAFLVPAGTGQKYRIDSTTLNGTCTLGSWIEGAL